MIKKTILVVLFPRSRLNKNTCKVWCDRVHESKRFDGTIVSEKQDIENIIVQAVSRVNTWY